MMPTVESFALPVRTTSMRRRRLATTRRERVESTNTNAAGGEPNSIMTTTTTTTTGLTSGENDNNNNDDESAQGSTSKLQALTVENEELRDTVSKLQADVERLQRQSAANGLILETFEGEFSGTADAELALMRGDLTAMEKWCDSLPDGSCPVEPSVGFGEALRDRAVWLIGLLVFQSASGLILAHNEELLAKHPVSELVLSIAAVQMRSVGI